MKEVKDFAFEDSSRNKYDWDTILNGKVWKLENGKDFKCSTKSMAALAKMTAKGRNLKIKTKVDGDDLVLQAEVI